MIKIDKDNFREIVFTANFILNKINEDTEKLYKKKTDFILNKSGMGENEVLFVRKSIRYKQEKVCDLIDVPHDAIDIMWDTIRFNTRAAGNILTEIYLNEAKAVTLALDERIPGDLLKKIEINLKRNETLFDNAVRLMKFEVQAYSSLTVN